MGVSPRKGFDDFPDTFSSYVANFSADALSLLFDHAGSALDVHASVISTNRNWLVGQVASSTTLELVDASAGRGPVALTGSSLHIERLSAHLTLAGFSHSKFSPGSDLLTTTVLRLSAPAVTMSDACKVVLHVVPMDFMDATLPVGAVEPIEDELVVVQRRRAPTGFRFHVEDFRNQLEHGLLTALGLGVLM